MFEVRVLGELELRRSGRVLALPASKKSRALLGVLVVTGRQHSREALCDLLWPGPSDPRAALRWSLTKLRALVDEARVQRLVADREHVAFEPKACTIDLLELQSLGADLSIASTDALLRVAGQCRGELLEGLDLDDCYRYREWCVAEREAVRGARVRVLSALVQRLSDRPEEALVHARARVAIDPLAEAAHVEVIRILGQLGRRKEALAQFETCRRILQLELGAQPSRALMHARATLGAPPEVHESEAPPSRETAAVAQPLVGRRAEREEISARVAGATRASAQPMMLFVGEPGIGKTRLLAFAAEAMSTLGGTVIHARAYEAERVRPYGPWLEAITALGSIADDAHKSDLRALTTGDGTAAGTQLFEAITRLFVRAASRSPLLLVVDDVQWFDDASTALLHALARSLPSSTLIAAAARGTELGDNAPMQRLVHALLREARLVERDLHALSREEITGLARTFGADEDAAERVFVESGGHPYFAVEISRALARGDHSIAPSLAAMIDDRLSRLGPLSRGVLPWAAAMRRTFDASQLARVTNLASAELLLAVTELEAHGVLTPKGAGYDFAHDLLRSAVLRRLSEPRRRLIHAQIARTMTESNDIAYHAALGGEHELAARASVTAAKQALAVFANHEAAMVARFGIEHSASLAPEIRLPIQVELLEVISASRTWRGRQQELQAEVLRVAAECEALALHEQASRAMHALSAIDHESNTAPELAFAHSMRAASVDRISDSHARAERLAASAKCLTFLAREMGKARVMLDEAGALAGDTGREPLDLHWGTALVLAFEGDIEGARRELRRTIDLATARRDPWARLECSLDLAMLELDEGRPAAARAIVMALEGLADKLDDPSEKAQLDAVLALASTCEGAPNALADMTRALDALRDVDAKAMVTFCRTALASYELERGDLAAAHAHAAMAVAAASTMPRRTDEVRARIAVARVELGAGRRDVAIRLVTPLLTELDVPHDLSARACAELRDVARALSIPTRVTTPTPTDAQQE